jgi:hypothetical protein
MSESLTTSIDLQLVATLTKTQTLYTSTSPISIQKTYSLTNGSGADEANNVYCSQRTLAASAYEELDLAESLVNAFSTSLIFTSIKAIYISSAAGNKGNLLVGGAASNAFDSWVGSATDKIKIRPGGIFMLACSQAGYSIPIGLKDVLKIENESEAYSTTYDIIIIGVSATEKITLTIPDSVQEHYPDAYDIIRLYSLTIADSVQEHYTDDLTVI